MEPRVVLEESASKIAGWLRERGGIAIWESLDLSNLGSATTPLNREDGTPTTKPGWRFDSKPARIITDPSEVVVSKAVEVRRFHVALRIGEQGMSVKLTDGSTRRLRSAVAKAGEGAFYQFDYSTQEAVIFKPEPQVPLVEWLKANGGAA